MAELLALLADDDCRCLGDVVDPILNLAVVAPVRTWDEAGIGVEIFVDPTNGVIIGTM